MINIYQSEISDLTQIMRYIKINFKRKNHILSSSKKVLKWLYFDKKKNKYNFLLAKKNKHKIIGLIGILKNSHYQKKKTNDVIWFSPLHSLNSERINFSGIKFISELKSLFKNKIIGTIGCNILVKKILGILGFKTGNLNQYFILNPNIKKFKLCNIISKNKVKKIKKNNYKLIKKKNLIFSFNKKKIETYERKFFKTKEYFKKKFSNNPFYSYFYYVVEYKSRIQGFFVARECDHKNTKVLRLVDFYGNVNCLSKIGDDLLKVIIENDYEYIDFYNYVINKKILLQSGFLINQDQINIIPNFFEPFEKKNITLDFAIWPKNKKYYLFKADCDQDRPSIL